MGRSKRDNRPDLYFIHNPITGLVKIGVSVCVHARWEDLERMNGVPLKLLGTGPKLWRYEYDLHCAFGDDRRIGEWFVATPELMALAKNPTREAINRLLVARAETVERYVALHDADRRRLASERSLEAHRRRRENGGRPTGPSEDRRSTRARLYVRKVDDAKTA